MVSRVHLEKLEAPYISVQRKYWQNVPLIVSKGPSLTLSSRIGLAFYRDDTFGGNLRQLLEIMGHYETTEKAGLIFIEAEKGFWVVCLDFVNKHLNRLIMR